MRSSTPHASHALDSRTGSRRRLLEPNLRRLGRPASAGKGCLLPAVSAPPLVEASARAEAVLAPLVACAPALPASRASSRRFSANAREHARAVMTKVLIGWPRAMSTARRQSGRVGGEGAGASGLREGCHMNAVRQSDAHHRDAAARRHTVW